MVARSWRWAMTNIHASANGQWRERLSLPAPRPPGNEVAINETSPLLFAKLSGFPPVLQSSSIADWASSNAILPWQTSEDRQTSTTSFCRAKIGRWDRFEGAIERADRYAGRTAQDNFVRCHGGCSTLHAALDAPLGTGPLAQQKPSLIRT